MAALINVNTKETERIVSSFTNELYCLPLPNIEFYRRVSSLLWSYRPLSSTNPFLISTSLLCRSNQKRDATEEIHNNNNSNNTQFLYSASH